MTNPAQDRWGTALLTLLLMTGTTRPQEEGKALPPTQKDVHYGPHERHGLDFWQAKAAQSSPVLISIHGGGFRSGNKSVGPQLLKECLDVGISVATITYRLSNQAITPAQFHDAARAVQFLRSRAKGWNLDPNRVAAKGDSAGAGLSLWLAFHDDLANPENDDPVRRQSTRLSCAAVFNGQTSYDPCFFRTLFPGKDVYKHPALAQLFGVDLDMLDDLPAEKYRLFEEVSAQQHLSKDDPTVMLTYGSALNVEVTNQGVGIHHRFFGKVLKEQTDGLQIPCELYAANQRVAGGTPMRVIDVLKEPLGIQK